MNTDNYLKIIEDDINDIKAMFAESNTVPPENETVEIEDNDKIRIYKYCNGSWNLQQKTTDNNETKNIEAEENNKKIVSGSNKKRKKNICDDLKCVLDLLENNKIPKAINIITKLIESNATFNIPKRKRAGTKYNDFISIELKRIKKEEPNSSPSDRMRIAVSNYHKENNKQKLNK